MEERLLREIQISNPWWFEKKETIPAYKRKLFSDILKYLRTKQILAVIGLRRVGKTVLLKQAINEILSSTPPKNILFFSFEEKWGTVEYMEEIFYHFIENVAGSGKKYIFFDEIQKVKGWEDVLKRFYDRYEDIKFIISGSASIHISKSIESLAGRIFDFYITPLSFLEFLELNDVKIEFEKLEIMNYEGILKLYETNLYQKEKVVALFNEYLFKGGFPEIAKEMDEEVIRKYMLNSLIDRILLKDLPEEFEIKKTSALREILEYSARETSGIFVIDKLSGLLKLSNETVSNYVEYLKRAFLIYILYNYTGSIAKQIRTSKKIHIVLPSVAIALESYGREALLYPQVVGNYVESAIATFLTYRYNKIFFWRTPQKDEVDIVLKNEFGLLGVEVKYRSQIDKEDIKSLLKFCGKFQLGKGIIVTKELLEIRKIEGREIMLIPAWLFLLAVGSS